MVKARDRAEAEAEEARKKEEEEEALSNEKLSEIARENSLALSSLEARVAGMEKGSGDKSSDRGSNILRLPPLAAE